MAKIKQIDTTSLAIKRDYLETSAALLEKQDQQKRSFHAGEVLKLAFIRMAADAVELKGEDRASFIALLDATPGWFGCGNNSACRQAFEKKGALADVQKSYAGF